MPSHAVPSFCWCLLSVATAQEAPVERWIEQLKAAAPEVRAAAHAQLLALGKAAVVPLAAQLESADDFHLISCLGVLDDLGPLAGAAVPVIVEMVKNKQLERRRERVTLLLPTLAELVPHQDDPEPLPDRELMMLFVEMGRLDDAAGNFGRWRLRQRSKWIAKPGIEVLRTAVAGRDAMVAELAIERLGGHGSAAAGALPVLRGVLDRPEPWFLLTERRVALHRKAAQAILRIAPEGADAEVARQVLAGKWSPPVAVEPVVPERLRLRIDELVRELRRAEPTHRGAAADNLVALGAASARPVAALLSPDETGETIQVALDVLHRLGRQAASAVPAIADALLALPAPHPAAVLRTLATTLPWSEHVFVQPAISMSVDHLIVHGHKVGGTVDVAFLNEFSRALSDFHIALAVSVEAAPSALAALLGDPAVGKRRRALQVIATRGQDCAELLPALAAMLETSQPAEHVSEWINQRATRVREVDCSDPVQRLAAEAILAVAPTDHELVAAARARLAKPVVH